jgi:hypothetical protein
MSVFYRDIIDCNVVQSCVRHKASMVGISHPATIQLKLAIGPGMLLTYPRLLIQAELYSGLPLGDIGFAHGRTSIIKGDAGGGDDGVCADQVCM